MIMLLTAIILFVYMCLVWVIYRYLKNPSVVDVAWSFGLMISGVVYLFQGLITQKSLVFTLVLALWAFRLGLFLWFTRVNVGAVDKRYIALSAHWKISKSLGFFLNFQLQAILIWLIALPWLFIGESTSSPLSLYDGVVLVFIVVCLALETLADYQLLIYKRNPTGPVCDTGLWQYSRHPNYFFEWLIWCGFSLLALPHAYGFLGLIAPITLYFIMTKVTGPMTEAASIKSRGEAYIAYQKKVSMFFPW